MLARPLMFSEKRSGIGLRILDVRHSVCAKLVVFLGAITPFKEMFGIRAVYRRKEAELESASHQDDLALCGSAPGRRWIT